MVRNFLEDLQIVVIYFEIVLLIALSIYFLVNTWKKKGEKEIYGNLSLAICSFFLGYSVYKFLSMIWIYYYQDIILRTIGRIFLLFGALIFILILNRIFFKQIFKNETFRKTYLVLLTGCALITVILYYYYSNLESLLILLLVLVFLVGVLMVFSVKWMLSLSGIIRLYIGVFVIGIILFIGGAALLTVIHYLPEFNILNFILSFIEIGGILVMTIGVGGLPLLSELDWKNKIIHLYIIHSSGLVILEYSFKERESITPTLVGSGLTGVATIVKEITKSDRKLSIIRQEDIQIAFKYGNHVNLALLIEKDFKIIHDKLQELLDKFEMLYKEILPTWNGDLKIFSPVKVLVEQILI
jgi:hypothetical protein